MFEPYYYIFPAIRGIQAGMEYYTSMCPLKLIPKIFLYDEEELNPELRAQRTLNKARVPEIASYLIENSKSYVLSSLTASIDGDIEFIPISEDPRYYNIGQIKIPMTARFVINDGQHRRAAIDAALKKSPELGDETISLVLYVDLGLKRSQQMFSDLNRYAIRPTKSLSILYDNRDPFSVMVKELSTKVPIFKGLVEKEKSTISNRSRKLFTLSGIYHATKELLKGKQHYDYEQQRDLAIEFWNEIGENIVEWQMVKRKEISAASLRNDYINAHSITLIALGIAGNSLINEYPATWKEKLKNLKTINWHRDNTDAWEGRVIYGGKISASRINTRLLANYIKLMLEVPLSDDEKEYEKDYIKRG